MPLVRKADGRLEPYDRSKVLRTAIYLGLERDDAERLADEVSKRVRDGMSTVEILAIIHELAREIRPELKHSRDLREAISRMRSKPDFEEYVRLVLRAAGYMVEPGRVLEGRCVSHEIDGIAFKDDEVLVVEVKHHVNHHTYTGLDVVLQLWAVLEDLREGYRLGFHGYDFTSAILACNTKISAHAERYARCKGIRYMGWKYPKAFALSDIVSSHKLYPLTMIKVLSEEQIARLGDRGIVALTQLNELRREELMEMTGLDERGVDELLKLAEALTSR